MAESDNHVERTINDLVAKIEEWMKPIIEQKRLVNSLCSHAGLQVRYPDVESEATRGSMVLRRDQFHKKPLATAVREYLEQRGRSDRGGLGAATVNEIYDALIAGGYTPETDDEANAKRGLRIALTKNSVTFYRVSRGGAAGGAYGLLEWYPNAKPQDDEKGNEGKRKRGRPAKRAKQKRPKAVKPKVAENVIDIGRDQAVPTPKRRGRPPKVRQTSEPSDDNGAPNSGRAA